MSLFKGKKKKAYTKKNNNTLQTTIDSRHNNKINELENKRFSLNEKNTELDSMQNTLDKYNQVSTDQLSDTDINDKLNLQEKK